MISCRTSLQSDRPTTYYYVVAQPLYLPAPLNPCLQVVRVAVSPFVEVPQSASLEVVAFPLNRIRAQVDQSLLSQIP
jgi:hypothetical protein